MKDRWKRRAWAVDQPVQTRTIVAACAWLGWSCCRRTTGRTSRRRTRRRRCSRCGCSRSAARISPGRSTPARCPAASSQPRRRRDLGAEPPAVEPREPRRRSVRRRRDQPQPVGRHAGGDRLRRVRPRHPLDRRRPARRRTTSTSACRRAGVLETRDGGKTLARLQPRHAQRLPAQPRGRVGPRSALRHAVPRRRPIGSGSRTTAASSPATTARAAGSA